MAGIVMVPLTALAMLLTAPWSDKEYDDDEKGERIRRPAPRPPPPPIELWRRSFGPNTTGCNDIGGATIAVARERMRLAFASAEQPCFAEVALADGSVCDPISPELGPFDSVAGFSAAAARHGVGAVPSIRKALEGTGVSVGRARARDRGKSGMFRVAQHGHGRRSPIQGTRMPAVSARPERPVALVTGAMRGIGKAIAQRLGDDHDVIRHGRDDADLADPEAVARYVAGLPSPVHVLVNNAGVAPSAPLSKTDDEAWARTIAINLTAPFILARALLPGMVAAGWGRVVNVVSTAGLKGYAYTSAYSASKGGLLALTRALAAEFARKPVTVNAVCPGFTDTRIVQEAIANITAKTARTEAEARASLEKFSPQGRLIEPREVAAMVAYLASDDAASITGTALPLDGGETSL